MDFSNKQAIACYIDSNKILFYQGATGSVLELSFPPEVLSNLDLHNREKFEQLIESFIEQNNLIGAGVILIYSPTATFEKDFEGSQSDAEDPEIQKFIDMVPFEDVLSKTFKLDKKVKVIAVNNKVFESIETVLKKRNFLIYSVIPVSVLQETYSELAENIDLGFILSKIDSVKQFSMINGSISSNPTLEKKPEPKKQNKQLYALVGVFAILLLILLAVVITNISPKHTTKPSGQIGTPPVLPKPTILETSKQQTVPASVESSSTPSGTANQRP